MVAAPGMHSWHSTARRTSLPEVRAQPGRGNFWVPESGALLNQLGSSWEELFGRATAVRKPRGKKLVRGMHFCFFWQNSTGADCSGPKAMGKKKKKPFAAAIDNLSLFTWWVQN
ncbi:unnamed protein product [Gulo gulo]|uniref:Uncharacterized protein n=1 Tax=Gulo gulo TaxID=48420 RepID=A0A9X9PZV7_GULGU|nr:unnamed protein product [Gulo gulo]